MASALESAHERAMQRPKLARRIRRWTLLFGIVAIAWSWLWFGARWVPAGMDTVPDVPPGSFCVIDKRNSTVKVGSHVFVKIPSGEVVLSRVVNRTDDHITIEHPNLTSTWPDSRSFGELPVAAVEGTILAPFKPK
ncbi:MAG: hypothetical protein NXI31_18505 [bacterium]|nr:hypothetical protein [bacterium]